MKNFFMLIVVAVVVSCFPGLLSADELATAGGTRFAIREVAEDGTHPVPSDVAVVPVDARSRVTLAFDEVGLGRSENEGQWQSIKAVLEEIKQLTAQRTEALTRLNAARGASKSQIEKAQKVAGEYNLKFRGFTKRVKSIIGKSEYDRIRKASRSRAREGRGGFLSELAEWCSKELEDLTPSPDAFGEKPPEVQIEVVAFLEPPGQDRKPLHVENYDRLPEGVLKPLPRTGLQISSEEQAKLNQDLEYARQAERAVREIRREKDAMARQVVSFGTQLESRIAKAVDVVEERADSLGDRIEAIQTAITSKKLGDLATLIPALSPTEKALEEVRKTAEELRKNIAGIGELRHYDLSRGIMPAAEVVSPKAITTSLRSLKKGLEKLRSAAQQAPKQVEKDLGALAEDQKELLRQEMEALGREMEEEAWEAFAKLTESLPATMKLAQSWGKMLTDAEDQAGAVRALGAHSVPVVSRGLADLMPATVDLRRSGVKNGDYLQLALKVRDGEGEDARLLEEKSYVFRVGSMGGYREYTGQLLFAAPTSGPSRDQLQANVGVLVTWKYGFRRPKGFKKFLHWLNPGVGLHAISLHQGASTMEVGSGAALSLWDDLVTGGYGVNLGVSSDRGYYFVGIGILDLLHKMKKTSLPQN